MVRAKDSSEMMAGVRIDAMYTPFTFFEITKPDITLASTYTNKAGAFILFVPATAGHKATFLSATKIEAAVRTEGRLNHPNEHRSNQIVVTTYPWHSPEALLKAIRGQ